MKSEHKDEVLCKCSYNKESQKGGVLIETAISFAIYMFLLIAVIDICRYFVLSGVLHYSAYLAVDQFTKGSISLVTDTTGCQGEDFEQCQQYAREMKQALQHAEQVATLIASPIANAEDKGIRQWTLYNPSDYSGYNMSAALSSEFSNQHFSFAILRPGERAKRDDGTYFTHPTRPWGSGSGKGWPDALQMETWEQVFSTIPVVAHVECDFHPLLPGVPYITVTATQFAFHRSASFPGKPSAIATPDLPINQPNWQQFTPAPTNPAWPTNESNCGACPAGTIAACCLNSCYACPGNTGICSAATCDSGG